MSKSAEGERVHGRGDRFYREAMELLGEEGIEFLVGGGYALREYTGVVRDTKDFDIFLCEADVRPALALFKSHGYRAGLPFSHWLGKVHHGETFIDLVFRAGNGLCEVDQRWFVRTWRAELFGLAVRLVPPEFMLWQKAYIMERERYDGADVAHLIRSGGPPLDWAQLIELFGPDWRVLLSHLVLFGFIYPAERERVAPTLDLLLQRLVREGAPPSERICQGTLVSREQYLADVDRWGYADARLLGRSRMDPEQIRQWTEAIGQTE